VQKFLRILGITIASILALLFLLPILFPGQIEEKIKSWANQSINAKLEFSKARLSFFEHFPTLTLTLHDFSLLGSTPFEHDTLVAGKALSFGLDLGSVFQESIKVNKFFLRRYMNRTAPAKINTPGLGESALENLSQSNHRTTQNDPRGFADGFTVGEIL